MEMLDRYWKLLTFSIISTVTLGMGIFIYVIMHDYLFITLNNIVEDLITAGGISVLFSGIIEGFINNSVKILSALDYIWVIIFITLVWELCVFSYHAKRQGYASIFGFLSFGIMIFLFISSIFESVTSYLHDIFFSAILQNVTTKLTFFNFYIDNYVLVNLVIVCVCVVLNFVDFDTATFFTRKNKEGQSDVEETEI